jgi:hypothetical protein
VKRGVILLALLAARTASAAEPASTDADYERAVAEGQAGHAEVAARLFDELLTRMPPEDPLRTLSLYGAARAHQRVGTPEAACRALEAYRLFIARADAEPEKREKASNALVGLIDACRTSAPPAAAPASAGVSSTEPVSRPADHTWAWAASGAAAAGLVGGGVLLVLAGSALDDADAAYARFDAGGRTDAGLLGDGEDADDRARSLGIAGYSLLGVGAGLAGWATWLWLREPAAPGVTWLPAAGGVLVMGAWP